jgi:hypothetical protein
VICDDESQTAEERSQNQIPAAAAAGRERVVAILPFQIISQRQKETVECKYYGRRLSNILPIKDILKKI